MTDNEERVHVSEHHDPITYVDSVSNYEVPAVGALYGLYFAIYHSSADEVLAMPERVLKAYGRVQSEVIRGKRGDDL